MRACRSPNPTMTGANSGISIEVIPHSSASRLRGRRHALPNWALALAPVPSRPGPRQFRDEVHLLRCFDRPDGTSGQKRLVLGSGLRRRLQLHRRFQALAPFCPDVPTLPASRTASWRDSTASISEG